MIFNTVHSRRISLCIALSLIEKGQRVFTGIIDHTASIQAIEKNNADMQLTIAHQFGVLTLGESIAIDGVCLTVTAATENTFECQLSSETLALTTAGNYQVGQSVNCERAMQASDRFGGHIVTGHVDSTLKVAAIQSHDTFFEYAFSGVSQKDLGLLTVKGSAAINGVSLTINALTDDGFSVMLIPHTLAMTNLSALKVGDDVNVEYDYLAKLVQRNVLLTKTIGV